jgi:hypothetical protein
LVVVRICKSSVLILPQLLVRKFETIYSAAPHRHQWGTRHRPTQTPVGQKHRPTQTPVGHKAQANTDTSGAQGTDPYRHQWGTRHDKRRIKSTQFLTEL